jgi:predicted pyridoxine 5'-phosphate oxidase superfamily flavin-nucleotide-binding protein
MHRGRRVDLIQPPAPKSPVVAEKFHELAFTESVRKAQAHYYGKSQRIEGAPEYDALTEDETNFIHARDSFYMATVSETGWPYVQHRGGKPGFLRVTSPTALAFADYRGNRQLISTGNLAVTDRVTLFLMDYPQRTRLKILGHARVEDAREHPELVAQLAEPEVRSVVERLFFVEVVSFDWNCQQYITPRYTAAEVDIAVAPLKQRIAELEARLKTGK